VTTTQLDRSRYDLVELDGVAYAIIAQPLLEELCRRAGIELAGSSSGSWSPRSGLVDMDVDREALARRLIRRRKGAGLTQVDLARRAGIRAETLNRVERGKTTPDFATIRKLVVAMNEAEAECLA